MADCVLCDWSFNPLMPAKAVYRPGMIAPMRWGPAGPENCKSSDSVITTIREVATVAHWAVDHTDQLRAFIGEYEFRWMGPPIS